MISLRSLPWQHFMCLILRDWIQVVKSLAKLKHMGGSGVLSSLTRYDIESLPKDAPLPEGNTSGSAEGSMLQKELMEVLLNFI